MCYYHYFLWFLKWSRFGHVRPPSSWLLCPLTSVHISVYFLTFSSNRWPLSSCTSSTSTLEPAVYNKFCFLSVDVDIWKPRSGHSRTFISTGLLFPWQRLKLWNKCMCTHRHTRTQTPQTAVFLYLSGYLFLNLLFQTSNTSSSDPVPWGSLQPLSFSTCKSFSNSKKLYVFAGSMSLCVIDLSAIPAASWPSGDSIREKKKNG